MPVKIGIDIGSSTTKIVAFKDEQMLQPMTIKADTPATSLYAAFGTYLDKNNIAPSLVESVSVTGAGSKYIEKAIHNIPTYKVDEFVATGTGAKYLSDKKEFIAINMGTGSFAMKVTNDEMIHLGGVGLGGGTIRGLSSIMLKTEDINKITALAEKGNVGNIDLRIGDITKEKYSGLNLDITASNFGKANTQSKKEDIAAGLIHLVLENICQAGILASRSTGIKDYILIGGLTQFSGCLEIIENFKSLWPDIIIRIPKNAEYATVIGTVFVLDKTKEKVEDK